jgi:hypothetical protein
MALAQADPPQRSLRITTDRRLHQLIQSFQDPGLHLDRGLLSTTPAANPLAALQIPIHRGHLLRFDRGQATDLIAATIPI